jgi:hypothetical protein
LVLFFVSYATAQDDEEYTEEFLEEPIEIQLMKTMGVPLFWPEEFNQSNGSLKIASFNLEYIEFDLEEPLPQKKSVAVVESENHIDKSEKKEPKKKTTRTRFRINWGNFMLSSLITVAGGGVAYYGNLKAKEYHDKGVPASRAELDKRVEAAENWQIVRNIGYGIAAVGGLGLIVTIVF